MRPIRGCGLSTGKYGNFEFDFLPQKSTIYVNLHPTIKGSSTHVIKSRSYLDASTSVICYAFKVADNKCDKISTHLDTLFKVVRTKFIVIFTLKNTLKRMIKAQQKSSLEFNGYSFLVNQTNVHQTTKPINDQRSLANNLNSLFDYRFA